MRQIPHSMHLVGSARVHIDPRLGGVQPQYTIRFLRRWSEKEWHGAVQRHRTVQFVLEYVQVVQAIWLGVTALGVCLRDNSLSLLGALQRKRVRMLW